MFSRKSGTTPRERRQRSFRPNKNHLLPETDDGTLNKIGRKEERLQEKQTLIDYKREARGTRRGKGRVGVGRWRTATQVALDALKVQESRKDRLLEEQEAARSETQRQVDLKEPKSSCRRERAARKVETHVSCKKAYESRVAPDSSSRSKTSYQYWSVCDHSRLKLHFTQTLHV